MGKNQGFNKLTKGFTRHLTNSEQKRYYFFIANDRKVKDIGNLDVYINGVFLSKKTIDGSGRIMLGKSIITKMASNGVTLVLKGTSLNINF